MAKVNGGRCLRAARLRGICGPLVLALAISGVVPARAAAAPGGRAVIETWSVTAKGSHLQIAYGSGRRFPQYADLDKSSSYFRMINSTTAGFATSVILMPALWSKTSCPADYCRGARVRASWRRSGASLVLVLHGTIATLKVAITVTLTPPADRVLVARVSARVSGTVKLDGNRPGEAFKAVMLSSMHDSSTVWDSSDAFTGAHVYQFPSSGWIIQPPARTRDFGVQGGTSRWKTHAPTIEVIMSKPCVVTGWLTADTHPKHANVGFWCAASKVLPSWIYTLTAEAGSQR